jgi:hypothetical protein
MERPPALEGVDGVCAEGMSGRGLSDVRLKGALVEPAPAGAPGLSDHLLPRSSPKERLPTTHRHIADHAMGRQSMRRGGARRRARPALKALTNMARMGRPAVAPAGGGRADFSSGRISKARTGLRPIRLLARHPPVAFFCKTALTAPKRRIYKHLTHGVAADNDGAPATLLCSTGLSRPTSVGAEIVFVGFAVLHRKMPLFDNLDGRKRNVDGRVLA